MPDPARPADDPLRAITLSVDAGDDRERTFQAVPLSISYEDLGDRLGHWVLDAWDVERDAPVRVSAQRIKSHCLTVEQARRLIVRFEWRPEGE